MEKSKYKLREESMDISDSKSTLHKDASIKKIGYSKVTNDLISLLNKRKVRTSDSSINPTLTSEKIVNHERNFDENDKKNVSSVNIDSRISKSVQTEPLNDKILNYSIMDVETLRYQLENEIDSHIETEDLYERLKQEFNLYRTNTRSFIDEKQREICRQQQTITQLQLNNQLLLNIHNNNLNENNNLNQQIIHNINDRFLKEESLRNELKVAEENLNKFTAEKINTSQTLQHDNEMLVEKVANLQNELKQQNKLLLEKTAINDNQTIEIEKLQGLVKEYQRESYNQFSYFKALISRNRQLNNLINGEHSVDLVVPIMKNQIDSTSEHTTYYDHSSSYGSNFQSVESLNYLGSNKMYNNDSESSTIHSQYTKERYGACNDHADQNFDVQNLNQTNRLNNVNGKEIYTKYLYMNHPKNNLTPRYVNNNSNTPSIDKFMSQQKSNHSSDSTYNHQSISSKRLTDTSNTHFNQQGHFQSQKIGSNINVLPKYIHHQYL